MAEAYIEKELPPQPPRNNKDPESNFYAYTQWMVDLYRSLVLNGYYISRNESQEFDTFDGENLVAPGNATIATAQDTANNAYTAAENAQAGAESVADALDSWESGQALIENTATTVAVTFDVEKANASYIVVASVGASSGSGLPAECYLQTGITSLTTTGFTINIHTAPGAGNSVTYNWYIRI